MAHMQTNESIARPRCVALVDDEVQITQALQTLLSLKGVPNSVHHSAESLLVMSTLSALSVSVLLRV